LKTRQSETHHRHGEQSAALHASRHGERSAAIHGGEFGDWTAAKNAVAARVARQSIVERRNG